MNASFSGDIYIVTEGYPAAVRFFTHPNTLYMLFLTIILWSVPCIVNAFFSTENCELYCALSLLPSYLFLV